MLRRQNPDVDRLASDQSTRKRTGLIDLARLALLCQVAMIGVAVGQEVAPDDAAALAKDAVVDTLVSYDASFFDRYRPNTALDMVNQLPGFNLDDGDDKRGLGGSVGNLLINGRYPSAKQDKPSAILARIAASNVVQIELIQRQVRDIDLRGNPLVANLVLADDGMAAIRWELALRKNLDVASLTPSGSISMSDKWHGTDFNVGFDIRKAGYGDPGNEFLLDSANNIVETRTIDHRGAGFTSNGYLNATRWFGQTHVQLNSSIGIEKRDEDQITANMPLGVGEPPNDEVFENDRHTVDVELALDLERNLTSDLLGKGILLYYQSDKTPFSSQRNLDSAGSQTFFRQADTDELATESIARLELDWTGISNHLVKFSLEGARNVLDSKYQLLVDDGSGPVIVPVPGANTRVEEIRSEIQASDTFPIGALEFNYGVGLEYSTIKQTGDTNVERNFVYVKPRMTLTHNAGKQRQTRFHFGREVSQLDFEDFVSATVFEDNDVILGNPDLRPETTWIAEFSEERRFGEIGVGKLTLFHHWISDVEDLLPLGTDVEAPGNIGDGRRWGAILEVTLPLDAVGLKSARLNIKGRLQDSSVVDPVTFRDRVLSAKGGHKGDIDFTNENGHALWLDFRQDFDVKKISWGWNTAQRAERPLFKVNEYDLYDEDTEVNAFIETTRWFGMKLQLSATNILNYDQNRDRTVYAAERELSPVDYRELRSLTNGTRIAISVSGTF